MAYKVPEFPLTAAIFLFGTEAGGIPRLTAPCNVAFGRRVVSGIPDSVGGSSWVITQLLFPRGTDVRDAFSIGGADVVEVPQFSGRWYEVQEVNDLGQGFENEHRVAWCQKMHAWPAPLPAVYVPPASGGVVEESWEEWAPRVRG